MSDIKKFNQMMSMMSKIKNFDEILKESQTKALIEGVRFGQKELDATLENAKNFKIGIEYEFFVDDGEGGYYSHDDGATDMADSIINSSGMEKHIERLEQEHKDGMVEAITGVMPLTDGIGHIRRMFSLFHNDGLISTNETGMHVSLSYQGGGELNMLKLLILSHDEYIQGIFPERDYVESFIDNIRDNIEMEFSGGDEEFSLERVEDAIENSDIYREKYQTINLGDYSIRDGRIEFRFFGGENYEDRFDEIRWHIIRAAYLLGVSHGNVFDKEYHKALYKLYSDVVLADRVDRFIQLLDTGSGIRISNELYNISQDRKQLGKLQSELRRYLFNLPTGIDVLKTAVLITSSKTMMDESIINIIIDSIISKVKTEDEFKKAEAYISVNDDTKIQKLASKYKKLYNSGEVPLIQNLHKHLTLDGDVSFKSILEALQVMITKRDDPSVIPSVVETIVNADDEDFEKSTKYFNSLANSVDDLIATFFDQLYMSDLSNERKKVLTDKILERQSGTMYLFNIMDDIDYELPKKEIIGSTLFFALVGNRDADFINKHKDIFIDYVNSEDFETTDTLSYGANEIKDDLPEELTSMLIK